MFFRYEILFNILLRLPVKSLLRFKLVCKLWCAMISHPHFIKSHLEKSKDLKNLSLRRNMIIQNPLGLFSIGHKNLDCRLEDTSPLERFLGRAEILASCNGLLLVGDGNDSNYFLWNPSTRLHKQVRCQSVIYDEYLKHHCKIYGLGYDVESGAYKFMRVVRLASYTYFLRYPYTNLNEGDRIIVEVFNFKTGCWKGIYNFPYNIYTSYHGILVNGTPHWVVFRDGKGFPDGFWDFAIIYFDFVEEKFKEVETPYWLEKCYWSHNGTKFHFCGFGESLCLVKFVEIFDLNTGTPMIFGCHLWKLKIEVWVMREYGVAESWSKLFDFTDWFTKDELGDRRRMMGRVGRELVIYDPKYADLSFHFHTIHQNLKTAAYVESLVSPNGGHDMVG